MLHGILSGSIIDVRLFRHTTIIYERLLWHRRRYKLVQFIEHRRSYEVVELLDELAMLTAAVVLDDRAKIWNIIFGSRFGYRCRFCDTFPIDCTRLGVSLG